MRQLLIFVIAVLCIAEMAYATSPKEYSYVYDDDNSVGLAIPNSFNTDLRLALKEATNMNFAIAKGNGLSGTTLFLSYSADSLEIDSIKVLPDFKLYLDEWIDIQGHKARHLVYEYTIGEALFKYDTVLLVVNNVGYSISSYTLAAIFDNYKDTFSAIAASIQINRNSKEFYSPDGRIKATLHIYMEQTQEDPLSLVGRHLNIWVVMYPRKT